MKCDLPPPCNLQMRMTPGMVMLALRQTLFNEPVVYISLKIMFVDCVYTHTHIAQEDGQIGHSMCVPQTANALATLWPQQVMLRLQLLLQLFQRRRSSSTGPPSEKQLTAQTQFKEKVVEAAADCSKAMVLCMMKEAPSQISQDCRKDICCINAKLVDLFS